MKSSYPDEAVILLVQWAQPTPVNIRGVLFTALESKVGYTQDEDVTRQV